MKELKSEVTARRSNAHLLVGFRVWSLEFGVIYLGSDVVGPHCPYSNHLPELSCRLPLSFYTCKAVIGCLVALFFHVRQSIMTHDFFCVSHIFQADKESSVNHPYPTTLFVVQMALMGWVEDVGYPGGSWIDPLMWGRGSPEAVMVLRTKEIKNGRLAMLAFVGFCFQAIYTGEGPIENLMELRT
ncbi:hypothetical protein REPUB_Repub18cG0121100 [Reevesia pubescens]